MSRRTIPRLTPARRGARLREFGLAIEHAGNHFSISWLRVREVSIVDDGIAVLGIAGNCGTGRVAGIWYKEEANTRFVNRLYDCNGP